MAEYICTICNNIFDKQWKLDRHYRSKRKCKKINKEELYNCDICNKNYSTNSNLLRHKKKCITDQTEVERQEINLDNVQNSNLDVNSNNTTNNNTTNNNTNSNNTINSNNTTTNINVPDFIYPFGYEDISYISDDEKLRILTSTRAIIEALKVIYSKPQNCNIYRPNANKDNISIISLELKESIDNNHNQNNIISSKNNLDDIVSEIDIDNRNINLEESIHNEPVHGESTFEDEIDSESEQIQYEQRQKQYRKNNNQINTELNINAKDFDMSVQSIKYKSIINKITKNAMDFLLRLLHSCKYKLTCQDQLCILENIEDNRIHVSCNFYIEYVVNFLESHFQDVVYKDIFKKYGIIIRKEEDFKTNKIETITNLIKELKKFMKDTKQDTIDEDFLTKQIWTEEKEKRNDTNITDQRNNLFDNEIENTPRYNFFNEMKELEMKYFSEHGMSIGNLYKYRKILLERAQREVDIIAEEYNNKTLKDKIIRKLIKNNTFSLINRLKDIKFIDPSKLVSGLDTKKFSKLTYAQKEIPDCFINYIKGITEYENLL
jgi:hypothetical protein